MNISIKKRAFFALLLVSLFFICISASYSIEDNGDYLDNNGDNNDFNNDGDNPIIDSNNSTNPINSNNSTNPNGSINSNSSISYNTTLNLEINQNKVVTSSAYISISSKIRKSKPTELSQSSIILGAKYVNWYIYAYGKLPNSVKIAKYKYSMAEFLYLISKTIKYQVLKCNKTIIPKYNLKGPENIRGSSIFGSFSKNDYYRYVNDVLRYMNYYKVAPNLISTSGGSMQYQSIIFVFSKIVTEKVVPDNVNLSINNQHSLNKKIPKYIRPGTKNLLNSRYTGGAKYYLLSSRNCQSNSDYIKTLAKTITKGSKTKLQKAKAIYYWVRNNVRYGFYYNSKYGAKKAIKNRLGNCVDQSHAIVALCRASKIPARYVHGYCKFTSGRWYGHVWTQVLVGKTWYAADASNFELNGFGTVNNWKAESYSLKRKYFSLPF